MSKSNPKANVIIPADGPAFQPDIRVAIGCAVIAFLLYANTIGHGYVLDDKAIITGNEYVQQGIHGIGKILTTEVWHSQNISLGYYRPLSLVTFAIEQQLLPGNAPVSHFVNVLLYALTAFFVCLLMMRVFRNFSPWFAAVITCLFIAHPVHTEVVSNIKSRDEILSFLNLAISLLALLRAVQPQKTNLKWMAVSGLFFYLALLSKESAMTGILLVPVFLFFTGRYNLGQLLRNTAPFIFLIAAFQLQKYLVLGSLSGVQGSDIVNYPYVESGNIFASALVIFVWCIKLLFTPYPLSYSYAYNQIPAAELTSPLAIVGFLLAVGVCFVIYKNLRVRTPVAFGLMVFAICLIPAIAFVFLRGGIFAERFLYAPVLGFSVLVTWLLAEGTKLNFKQTESTFSVIAQNKVFAGSMLLIFFLYSFQTVSRNHDWKDEQTLIAHDVNVAGNNCQVHLHYGNLLINEAIESNNQALRIENMRKGLEQLNAALQINPHFTEAWYEIGQAYHKIAHNTDSAVVYYNHAIRENPGYALAYLGLATVYESGNQQQLASYYYNKALQINPGSAEIVFFSNAHKKNTGLDVKIMPAMATDTTDITIPGKDAEYYNQTGKAFGERGDFTNAVRYIQKAVELNPNSEDALINLSVCYAMLKNYQQSIEALERVLQINPYNEAALSNIVIMYNYVGNKDKATIYAQRQEQLKNKQ